MPKRTNENCLAGYECPKCKSQGPFWLYSMSWTRWSDDGTDESRDFEIMEDGGIGSCENCGHRAPVAKFKIDE